MPRLQRQRQAERQPVRRADLLDVQRRLRQHGDLDARQAPERRRSPQHRRRRGAAQVEQGRRADLAWSCATKRGRDQALPDRLQRPGYLLNTATVFFDSNVYNQRDKYSVREQTARRSKTENRIRNAQDTQVLILLPSLVDSCI